jgi:hypothetical protein
VKSIAGTLLLIQIALAVGASGRAWAERDNDPRIPSSAPDPSLVARPLSIESGVKLAAEQANKWLPDVYLLNASMVIDWPSDASDVPADTLPPGGWVSVTFVAPWRHDGAEAATLSLFFDRGSGQMFGQSQNEWRKAPPPKIYIPKSGPVSTTAVFAAEVAGGADFRAECPRERSRTQINLTSQPDSERNAESRLVWLISYTNGRNQNLGYRVFVDAETGAILKIEDNRVECGA